MTTPNLPDIGTVPTLRRLPRAFSNVQPFTYEDGLTHYQILEQLRAFVQHTLVPAINKALEEFGDEIEDLVGGTLNDILTRLDEQTEYVDTEIAALVEYVNTSVQSIINNSIEVQDPVVAGLLSASDSQTYETASRRFAPSVVAYSYDELVDAATYATHIVVPSGVEIELTSAIQLSAAVKRLTIDGDLIVTGNTSAIRADGSFGDARPLGASVSAGSKTIPAGTTGITEGEWFAVNASHGTSLFSSHIGYIRRALSVDSSTITLDASLPRDMDNSQGAGITVVPLNLMSGLTIEGAGSISHASPSAHTERLIELKFCKDVTISGLRIHDGGSTAISLWHCVNVSVHCNIDNMIDDLPSGHVGYGVDLRGASRGLVVGGSISRVRHAFTTNAAVPIAGYGSAGEPENFTVHPVTWGCTDRALDTHAQGWGGVFRVNDSGSAGAIQIRSDNNVIESIVSDGCRGVVVHIASGITVPPVIGPITATNTTFAVILSRSAAAFSAFPETKNVGGVISSTGSGDYTLQPKTIMRVNESDEFASNDYVDATAFTSRIEAGAVYAFTMFLAYKADPEQNFKLNVGGDGVSAFYTGNGLYEGENLPYGTIRRSAGFNNVPRHFGGVGSESDVAAIVTGTVRGTFTETAGELTFRFARSVTASDPEAPRVTLRRNSWLKLERIA